MGLSQRRGEAARLPAGCVLQGSSSSTLTPTRLYQQTQSGLISQSLKLGTHSAVPHTNNGDTGMYTKVLYETDLY